MMWMQNMKRRLWFTSLATLVLFSSGGVGISCR